ncbi:MAG: hypothetical protein ACLRVS_04310 [Lachnospiraceae bacterium]
MNEKRSRTVCFTGHREIPQEKLPVVSEKLKKLLSSVLIMDIAILVPEGRWDLILLLHRWS